VYPLMSSKSGTHAWHPFQHGPVESQVSPGGLASRDSLHLVGFEPETMRSIQSPMLPPTEPTPWGLNEYIIYAAKTPITLPSFVRPQLLHEGPTLT
jgi:hypothetical protein